MKALWLLYSRLILRPIVRERLRSGLTVLAIALGVAVVIAIELAGQAAAGSFHSSLEALTGKGALLITGTGGINEKLLGHLVQLPYDLQFSARIEDFASVDGKGEAVPFLGLDLITEGRKQALRNERPSLLIPSLAEANAVWVSPAVARRPGERIQLLINDVMHECKVVGILQAREEPAGASKVIVADIGEAQRLTHKKGRLDSVEVEIPPQSSPEYWQRLLERELPQSTRVEATGTRTEENRKMLSAFRWNLRVLSYIALIVGAFLIYNTISISVVRRRAEIGITRAIGATRGLVLCAFLGEAVFFSLAGSLLGLVLGRILALGAVRLIGTTVRSLYVSSQPASIQITGTAVLIGMTLGITVSILAALAPAIEASYVSPVEAMARGREQFAARVASGKRALLALILVLTAVAFSQLPPVERQPIFAYGAVLLLVAGTAALIPELILSFVKLTPRLIEKLLGVEGVLAARALEASLGRTSILTAALATAVAMTSSVGIMVGSFRETVAVWMDSQLKADFYLRPAAGAAADQHPTMSPDVADRIERLPGVASVDRFRAYPISYEGVPATLAGGEGSKGGNSASTRFLPGEDQAEILSKLGTGDYAVVSEPFANKHNIKVGQHISLPLAGSTHSFQVLGIYYDYSTERGYIVLDRQTLLKYLPDPAESTLAVYLERHADAVSVRQSIDDAIGGRDISVVANGMLRQGAMATFDRTFRITYALEAVAVIVAVMGIAGALLAMILDRRREFALLRFLGASRRQVRKLILCEAGLLGWLANGVGLVLGAVLSLILIFVINKQSFGWTIQLHWPVAVLVIVLSGIYTATLLAGLYPARMALQMDPIEMIHEE